MKKYIYKCDKVKISNLVTPVFASQEYLSSLTSDFGWLSDGEQYISFVIKKKWIFKILIFTSSPFNDFSDKDFDSKKFIKDCVDFAKIKLKIDYIQKPPTNVFFESIPSNVKSIRFGTFQIDLRKTEDTIFSELHGKHRNVIRKAIKEGLFVKKNNKKDVNVLNLINDTLMRQNLPKLNIDLFDNSITFYYSVFHNNLIQGAAIFFWSAEGAYYMYGGSIKKPKTGAMNLLHWEAIRFFKSIEVRKYDFVGARNTIKKNTKIAGIQKFKERFGGEKKMGFTWKKTLTIKGLIYENLVRFKTLSKNIDIIDENE